MKLWNKFGTEFRGTLGKDMVASSWKGHDYLRAYVVPHDPKTELQLQHRAIWRQAVAAWHALTDAEAVLERATDFMRGVEAALKLPL